MTTCRCPPASQAPCARGALARALCQWRQVLGGGPAARRAAACSWGMGPPRRVRRERPRGVGYIPYNTLYTAPTLRPRQVLKRVDKGPDGRLAEEDLMPVRFVPLHGLPDKQPPQPAARGPPSSEL